MAATASPEYASQLRFCRALDIVRSFPLDSRDGGTQLLEPSAADKLSLYALYKQATQGNCNTPRPSSRQVVEYAKWKAWDRMRGMSPVEAQRLYVNGIVELLSQVSNIS
ncbi:acyl-CoA-binding protein [Syncephalastrum racemosum]|uniref:Acyl-CoA-binding protein n=1 Tax=Syncephalastrum racemosum TaxID=13706 RepID=A0A1X2HLF1_SYNRA|nr:acyl-CoA-binding protein [Syncephalastrum racemosum]